MTYFRLASDCFLVEGENDGAIYDVHTCRVFLLDEKAHKILRRCEDNEPLGDWLGDSGMSLLKDLQEAGLGFFDKDPAYVDKLLLHQPVEWKGMCLLPPKFFRVDWAITNKCNLNCNFCGQRDKTISWQSCQTCLRRDRDTREWVPDSPEDFVAHIASLGARVLHIRGGNPLLAWDYLLRIVQAVRSTSLYLVITTHGIGRQIDELLELCSGGQVQLNIVMFSDDDKVTGAVCGREGVLAEQLALIDALARARITFFVTFLLSEATRLQRHRIVEFVRERWNGVPSIAEIYFREAVGESFRLSHVGEHAKPLTPWRSVEEFFFRVRYNSCTFGNFEVSSDGKLRSCAGIHRIHGDVADGGLHKALSGNGLYEMWELNKGSVRPCRNCALRYACTDCSVFELAGEEDSKMKEAYCPHEPRCNAPRANRKTWLPPGFALGLGLSKEAPL